MSSQDEAQFGIQELADRAGVSRRTVRYYVQRGLLPVPTGTGRGKHYNARHLEALVRVRNLQEAGVSLAEIERPASGDPEVATISQAPLIRRRIVRREAYLRIEIAPGIELHIDHGLGLDRATSALIVSTVQQIVSQSEEIT
jgi:DNA-binding transcriptional MerR regulator